MSDTTTKPKILLSFHDDPAVKEKYLSRLRAHRAADEIIQGTYWENGKGCAVGCTIHSDRHSSYETELGIPEWLAYLEDEIFEKLKNGDAKDWPIDFLEAIPVGVDLELIKRTFLAWMLVDEKDGLFSVVEDKAIKPLVGTIGKLILTESKRPLSQAEIAEGDKAAWAAGAAGDAWAAWAAWAAGDAWAARAARAAWAAGAAGAARAAGAAGAAGAAWAKKASQKILALLKMLEKGSVRPWEKEPPRGEGD